MDRHTALDKLELVRPDADDLQDPEFADALASLEADERARETFARRQAQDRQIARAMREVAVPEGLKNQLLAALNAAPAGGRAVTAEAPAADRSSRRRWILSALVVMASCILAGVGVWWFHDPAPALLTVQELQQEAPFSEQKIRELQPFRGDFEPATPQGYWMTSQFAFSSPSKGFSPNREGADRVAVYEFTFRDPRDREPGELRGVMLVVPKSHLEAAPTSTSYFGAAYTTVSSQPNVAIRTWTENELVYICMIPIQHEEALSSVLDNTGV